MEFQEQLKTNRTQAIQRLAQAKFDEWNNDGHQEVVRCLALLLANFDDGFLEQLAEGLSEEQPVSPTLGPVEAVAESDDHRVRIRFGAVGYLATTSYETLRNLAKCGWGGDYPADDVALAYKDGPTKPLFDYLEIVNAGGGETVGFECHLDEPQVLAWLSTNRPEQFQQLSRENLL